MIAEAAAIKVLGRASMARTEWWRFARQLLARTM
jgi:hypothetical protein